MGAEVDDPTSVSGPHPVRDPALCRPCGDTELPQLTPSHVPVLPSANADRADLGRVPGRGPRGLTDRSFGSEDNGRACSADSIRRLCVPIGGGVRTPWSHRPAHLACVLLHRPVGLPHVLRPLHVGRCGNLDASIEVAAKLTICARSALCAESALCARSAASDESATSAESAISAKSDRCSRAAGDPPKPADRLMPVDNGRCRGRAECWTTLCGFVCASRWPDRGIGAAWWLGW